LTQASPSLLPPPPGRPERLIAIAATLIALFAIVIMVGMFNLNRVHDDIMDDVERTRSARIEAYGLMQASIDAETGQRGFLLSNDTEFLEPYNAGRTAALQHMTRLTELSSDHPQLAPSVERAESLTQRALAALQTTIDARRAGQLSNTQFRAALNESKDLMDSARAETGNLIAALEGLIDETRAEEERIQHQLIFIASALAALALIAVALTLHALRFERRSWRAAYQALAGANIAADEAHARAAASDRAKARFLAVASHDMRQPLHALSLYLAALERRGETEETRGIVAKMERAVHSMGGMFTSVLDLARLQAGVVTPELSNAPLQEVFDAVSREHVNGKVDATATPLVVNTDARLLERVLSNLVANAVKHGGGLARLSAQTVDGAVEITIADDGPGIAPADQQRVFQEFERLGARSDGLGLGLTIVRQLADLLDLKLTLESEANGGARFTLHVPLADGAATSVREQMGADELKGVSILVMDDDALAREAITGLLRDFGAEVRACADGAEAEAAIEAGYKPKLLVLDLRIHGELLGLTIAKNLRGKIDPPPHAIMVTGDTEPETLAALRASGHAWLIKPINPQDLCAAAAGQLRAA